MHFASLCLTAFVFHFYTPIGTYKDLDLVIAFLRSAGLIMFAPLFLHFSTIYPVRYHLFEDRRWRSGLLYIPAAPQPSSLLNSPLMTRIAMDRSQRIFRIEGGAGEHHRRTRRGTREHTHDHAEAMVERHRYAEPVAAGEPSADNSLRQIGRQYATGQQFQPVAVVRVCADAVGRYRCRPGQCP